MNRLDIVKFLLNKHANIEARNVEGGIPLELAIQSGYKDIEEVLRQAQLDLNKELLNAAKSRDLDKVKECIKRGADVNTKGSNGRTSLHWAAFEGCLSGVEYLIEKGAGIDAKDNTGRTPLHYATRNGYLSIVQCIIEKGANFDVKDKDGKTPLDLASWKKHDDVEKYLKKIKEERPVQRKRRHHSHSSRKPLAIDLSNQREIVASSGTRPSSWVNGCISWVKKLAASTFSIISGLPAQYNIGSIPDKNDDINVKSDNNNIPQSISSVGWNNFLNNENIALASCVVDALDNTPSRRYQNLISKGIGVVPSRKAAVEFALRKFDSFVEGKIRNLDSKEQARIRVELKYAYPEITASFERGVEFSGNVGLDNVLEKCKKCFCTNVLPKDKVSTCLSDVGVTKLGNNLNR